MKVFDFLDGYNFISNVGDDLYFSIVLKIQFDIGIVRFLGHRAKPLGFFTV